MLKWAMRLARKFPILSTKYLARRVCGICAGCAERILSCAECVRNMCGGDVIICGKCAEYVRNMCGIWAGYVREGRNPMLNMCGVCGNVVSL